MAVAVNPDVAHVTGVLKGLLDPLQQCGAHRLITLVQVLRQQLPGQHLVASLPTQPPHPEFRPDQERLPGTDLMHTGQGPAKDLPCLGRIQLRGPPRHPGKSGEAEFPVFKKSAALEAHGRRHRQLRGRHLLRKNVLLVDLGVAPAGRPIELQHQHPVGAAELVHAVFVAVEGKQPPIDVQADGSCGVEHDFRAEARERLHIRGAAFVYHPAFTIASSSPQGFPMNRGTILVTGGAGYIGSHTVLQLRARGERVVVLDDLSRGFRQAVLDTPLVVGKVGDRETVLNALRTHGVDTVMHFAAYTIVPESVAEPLKYYGNNTCSTRNLLECCVEAGVRNFVFSSTAAVYGIPAEGYAAEDTTTAPINPYGTSKLMSEWMLRDVAAASPMKYVALRYFNVAGSDTGGRIGQATPKATLLVKVAVEAAVGKRPHVSIFGTDYATPDGTGIRDYIHVEDLATAHLDALEYLRKDGDSTVLNVGYGHGYSVRQVLESVERAAGKRLNVKEEPRRAGDPPALVARADRIRAELGWKPRLDDLDTIVTTALKWEQHLLKNPW